MSRSYCRRGGWPEEVNSTDPMSIERFRRKVEIREEFNQALDRVEPWMVEMLKENLIINLFEDDFGELKDETIVLPPSIESLAVFSYSYYVASI